MENNKEKQCTSPELLNRTERSVEMAISPKNFSEFVGHKRLKEKLKMFVKAAKDRKEALDHSLFYGPPGLGKTTLARIIAREMNVNFQKTSGPALEKPGDLAALLTNLSENSVFFIDEIHRLNKVVEEALYPAMQNFQLDIIVGEGPSAKSLKLELPRFTLTGATTRAGLITGAMRDRFGIQERLKFYRVREIKNIVLRSAKILNVKIKTAGAKEIAKRSRGTPRIANRLLRRVRDYAQVKASGIITKKVADRALKMFDVDREGLDDMDRKILTTIIEKFAGGPVGLNSLAVAVGEEEETICDMYEPYLILSGFLKRTPGGRKTTKLAYEHLDIEIPSSDGDLFS